MDPLDHKCAAARLHAVPDSTPEAGLHGRDAVSDLAVPGRTGPVSAPTAITTPSKPVMEIRGERVVHGEARSAYALAPQYAPIKPPYRWDHRVEQA
jgi:hypothetical protein